MNANFESLMKVHGGDAKKAEAAYREIADKGGFGPVGTAEGQIHLGYAGGLDLVGVLDANNTAISSKDKDRIAELAGVSRKDAENHVGESSAPKTKKSVE